MAYAWAPLSRAFGGGARNPAPVAGVVPARIGEAAARIALRAKHRGRRRPRCVQVPRSAVYSRRMCTLERPAGFSKRFLNIQRRMADHHFAGAESWEKLVAAHDRWVEQYNTRKHSAHEHRKDARRSPSEVLGFLTGVRHRP